MLKNFYSNKIKILEKSIELFYKKICKNSSFSQLRIGCELELFLLDKNNKALNNFNEIDIFCNLVGGKREQGDGQIEVVLNFTNDLIFLASEVENSKQKIANLAKQMNFLACFDGKPFEDDCGSSLQFNISLHNDAGTNIFYENSSLINYCATGLLDLTNSMLLLISPNVNDYQRFDLNNNKNLFKNHKYVAPVNLSLGNDNRSCAIRICNSHVESKSKRLEYRVPSASCDAWLGLGAIILALEYGLENHKSSYQAIYGNAFDEIYSLPKILSDHQEAIEIFFDKNNYILRKFEEFIKV
ncbi:MAG: hypothetical protein FJX30_02200 [Alphaproteobacteria bacterium]|nr:hypothetical protein [Alphaproteobacteria bacterium]